MFEQLRQSINELLARATKPEERRMVFARMKSTLVQAKLGVDDLRDALTQSKRKLELERRELETVLRRKQLALGINDAETVTIAERFEKQHGERIRLLEEKVAIQTREVDMADRELDEMRQELRAAMAGAGGAGIAGNPSTDALDDPLDDGSEAARAELDALARQRVRDDRDAEAARRLEELKRRMGK